jgi:hypothetical protein
MTLGNRCPAPLATLLSEQMSTDTGTTNESRTFRFYQELAGIGQSLWCRIENAGVTTCTAHSERIHREANPQCPRSPNLLGRIAVLIALVTRRFEFASKFQAEQPRKELKKLKKIQKAAGLTAALRCSNPGCGWQAVYAHRYRIPGFLCVHTVGNGTRGAFPSPEPINRLFNIQPLVFRTRCQMAEMNSFRRNR